MNELAAILYMVRHDLTQTISEYKDSCSPDYLILMDKKYAEHDIFALLDRLLFTGLEGFYAHEDMIKKAKKGNNKIPGDNRIYGFLADDYNVISSYDSIKTSSCPSSNVLHTFSM